MSSHLLLFAQVPVGKTFYFGDNPNRQWRKTSEKWALRISEHTGKWNWKAINPGVLVFLGA